MMNEVRMDGFHVYNVSYRHNAKGIALVRAELDHVTTRLSAVY